MTAAARTPRAQTDRPRLTLLIARARNGVIGKDRGLPWHIPEELRHFRQTTTGHAVIMGRLTWESIGRPLPQRRMIVVSRNPAWSAPGCEHALSLEAAIALAGTRSAVQPQIATDEVFVIGGAQLYEAALPLATRILLTEIDLEPAGDVWLDAPDPRTWQIASRVKQHASSGVRFDIVDYRRIVDRPG